MANGTINGNFAGGSDSSNFKYRLVWTSTADPANLRSIVNLSWYVISVNYAVTTHKANAGWTKTVDGKNSSGNANFNYPSPASIPKNTPKLFRSESVYVSHDPDGTKSFTISGTIDLSGTSAGNGSLSGTITLDPIAIVPPTATGLTYTETGTAYGLVGAYVAGFTKFNFTATATAGDAPIASYSFYRGTELIGIVYTSLTSATLVMQTYEPSGSWVYRVVVADTANNTAEYSLSEVTVLPYSKPTISAQSFRCDSDGTMDNDGTWGYFDMSYTVAQVGTNAATIHRLTVKGSNYNTFPQKLSGFNITDSYDAEYYVEDTLGGYASETQTIDVSYVNFELYPSSVNGGASFGEQSQAGKFIVNLANAIFRGDMTIATPLGIASGGTGMNAVATSTNAASISTSGITIQEQSWVKWGKVAMGCIRISGTIGAAGSVSGTLASGWLPYARATGSGYYDQSPFIMQVTTTGSITIRNASGSSRSPSSSTPLTIAVTYILAD